MYIMDSNLIYDKPDQVDAKVNKLRKVFKTFKTLDLGYRLKQLQTLRAAVKKYEKEMDAANNKDLGHSPFMSFFSNTAGMLAHIDAIIHSFQDWAKPRYTESPVAFAPCTSYVIAEPHGVVLIMGAWNFNFSLSLIPLATAISAGNVCLVKPSEMAPASAIIIQKICEELDSDIVQVCHGERETCEALLANRFDLIFFTGSPMKGKLVATAAAQFLTPCILELGGQNPCIVDRTASITNAVHNLLAGRFMNSGQICLAPEYVFVEESMLKSLTEELSKAVKVFYGNAKESPDYSRMINEWHADRLSKLVKEPGKGARFICGGDYDIKQKYIEPTILEFDTIENMRNSNVAKEEIFGPILYLVAYKSLDKVVEYINSRDKPLAMYYFGTDNTAKETLIKKTSSGAFLTNDTIIHYANEYLPFGGVGFSGYGSYHGKWGFDNLSHLKPVMDRGTAILPMRYPPYKPNESMMRFLLSNLNYTQSGVVKFFLYVSMFVLAIVFRNSLMDFGRGLVSRFSQ